jgi:hypothetical protein
MVLRLSSSGRVRAQALAAALGVGLLATWLWSSAGKAAPGGDLSVLIQDWGGEFLDEQWSETAAMVQQELLGRMEEGSAWALEHERDPELLGNLRRRHWGRTPRFEQGDAGAYACRWTADSFAASLTGQPEALADALPGIRVVDLVLTLELERRSFSLSPCLEIRCLGGRLDGPVGRSLSEAFQARGLVVRMIQCPVGQVAVPLQDAPAFVL